ncbi:UDP-Glycosyltransferase/glycogen phosphorylase [Ceraceosorus guamensis]|uniref:UDP-Glycosyltransferase/glycogen phosphorylase n=1 Tax=Ceraceosorus guamensis TaxID=1522189 RepID=A0A316VV84_9BASI|nr:UDP-Glycosyltransferase/glycogen phosphorylase [Ceraceosorus guamensis]PWN41352.1 UDP-Glycosyltransferase/glycogen phosphorylase [Ceraceosorus guamensis]
MRFLFVSNPATGQVNPLLAISSELLSRGHEVHFCSADRLSRSFGKMAVKTGHGDRGYFHGVGSGRECEDLTDLVQSKPDLFHNIIRHKPGALTTYLNAVCKLGDESTASDVYKRVVFRVRDVCIETKADMIIVDNFSPFAMDGVRLSGLPYIQTSPAAACAAASFVNLFKQPVGLSGADSGHRKADGSRTWAQAIFLVWRNFTFVFSFVWWCMTHPYAKEKRRFRKDELGLPPVDFLADSYMTPAPHLVPHMRAALSFNVAGLDLYDPKVFHEKVFFVGPCFAPGHGPKAIAQHSSLQPDAVKEWLDESEEVIYVNMGSIFYYPRDEYDALIDALKGVKAVRPNMRALIKIPDLPTTFQPIPGADELPGWIRRETWVPSVETVLAHPSVKIAMHHGGGNSFNEAVAFGKPQLIVSMWGETHDIMAYAVHHGIAMGSKFAPRLVASDLQASMTKLLEENIEFADRALRWRLRSEQSGGTPIAADIIEAYGSKERRIQGTQDGDSTDIEAVNALTIDSNEKGLFTPALDKEPQSSSASSIGSPTIAEQTVTFPSPTDFPPRPQLLIQTAAAAPVVAATA